MSGAYLPITLSHVYNASQKSKTNVVSSAMRYGKGMRLNVSLKVESCSISGYPYKFIDADGTIHYFRLESGSVRYSKLRKGKV